MDGDPGLSQEPWVRVELRDGGVHVDGVPVQLPGSVEDRYLAALQQVATEVAAPLGRRVGVTVTGAAGVVAHLAIHPDGTTDSIEDLVRAAQLPAAVPEPRTPGGVRRATEDVGGGARHQALGGVRPARRPVRAALGGTALVAAVVTVIAAVGGADGAASRAGLGGAPPGGGRAVSEGDPGVAVVEGRAVSPGALLQRRLRLRPVVTPDGPCRVRVLLRPATRTTSVIVRIEPSDGPVVVRRLTLRGDRRTVLFDQVAPGPARWRVSAPGARAVSGRIEIMPPPAVAPAATAPAPAPATAGKPGKKPAGRSDAAPLIPVDPDDQ